RPSRNPGRIAGSADRPGWRAPTRRRACATPGNYAAIPRSSGASVSAFSHLIPQVTAGKLEEHILEARRPVQVAQLRMLAQIREHRRNVGGIDEHRVAGTLDARREGAGALQPG